MLLDFGVVNGLLEFAVHVESRAGTMSMYRQLNHMKNSTLLIGIRLGSGMPNMPKV